MFSYTRRPGPVRLKVQRGGRSPLQGRRAIEASGGAHRVQRMTDAGTTESTPHTPTSTFSPSLSDVDMS